VIDLSGKYDKKIVKQGPQKHWISHKTHTRTTTSKEIKLTPTKHTHNPNPLTKSITKLGKRSGTHQRKRQWHTIAQNDNTKAQSDNQNHNKK